MPDINTRSVRFLSDILEREANSSYEFENTMANIVEQISLDNKYSFDVKLQISKNIFDFLCIISKLDINKQILLALGFSYSSKNFFSTIGNNFLISKISDYLQNDSIRNIPFSLLEKCYFLFLQLKSNNEIFDVFSKTKSTIPEESRSESKEKKYSNDSKDKDNKVPLKQISLENIFSKLSKIMLSNDWSCKSSNPVFPQIETVSEKEKILSCGNPSITNLTSMTQEPSHNLQNTDKDFPSFNPCTEIYSEKLVKGLGPSILLFLKKENFSCKQKNNTFILGHENSLISSLYDFTLNEKRLVDLILFIHNNYSYYEEKEQRLLMKLLLKNINHDLANQIEENIEKKINLSWNLELFYKNYKQYLENMSVSKIYDYLDSPDFNIRDKKSYESFCSILTKLNIPNHLVKKTLCHGAWKNSDNQIEFIYYLLSTPNELMKDFVFNADEKPSKDKKRREILRNQKIHYDFSHIKSTSLNNFLVEIWSSQDILDALLKIGRGDCLHKTKCLFAWAIANVPENIVIGLFHSKKDPFLYQELMKEIFPIFLGSHVNAHAVLDDLWGVNQKRFIETVSFLYKTIPHIVNLNKILDITQKNKESLIPMVTSDDHEFAIWLATLAIKRDFLNIDQWITERIAKKGDEFIHALLDFLRENVINEFNLKSPIDWKENVPTKNSRYSSKAYSNFAIGTSTFLTLKDQILEKSQLTIEAIAIMFEHLSFNSIQCNNLISKQTLTEISIVYKQIFEMFDELQVHPPTSVETEEKANLLFRNLFSNETNLDTLTEQMKRFKESENKKDNEVFACMLHSMLDEYRFFSKYPDKELILMGSLFGKILHLRLIDGVIESIALKYIIDGFKKPQGKLIIFSIKAVEQFVDITHNWPLFLEELYKTTNTLQGELYEKISEKYHEYLKNNESLGISNTAVIGASTTNYNLNTNPNNSGLQSKLLNIHNNPINNIGFMGMVPNNIPKSQIKNNKFNTKNEFGISNSSQNYFPSTTNTIPNPSTNKNFGNEKIQLNANQMPFNPTNIKKPGTKLSSKELNYSTNITLIKKVYTSDVKFKENVGSQINALKNLALSLSQVTLLKNKPLLAKDLNLKEILKEAYVTGKLFIATSFVCKFVEQIQKSKIFHNKNPWIKSILVLLSEIYYDKKVITAVKKEVEELFQKLGIEITQSSSTVFSKLSMPKNSPDMVNLEQQDKEKNDIENSSVSNSNNSFTLQNTFTKNPFTNFNNPSTDTFNEKNEENIWSQGSTMNAKYEEIISLFEENNIDMLISDLCEQIKSQINNKNYEKQNKFFNDINPNVCTKENIGKILTLSLLNTINQILYLVVERTVNISMTTTRVLVIKDFAFETDPEKFKKAIILNIKSLSSSLANITCKDPLKQGLVNQIKEQLSKSKLDAIYDVIKIHSSLNKIIEVGSYYIRNYVVLKSVEKAQKDPQLVEEIVRRQNGELFSHLKNLENKNEGLTPIEDIQKKILKLPPFLRPGQDGASVDILRIYEDFEKLSN